MDSTTLLVRSFLFISMTRRTLLLIVPLVLIALGAAAFALRPTEEVPVVPTPQAEVPSESTDARDESVPVVIPVVATAETTTALRAAEAPATATLIVEGVSFSIRAPEGATIEEAMAGLKAEGVLAYELRSYTGLGAFVKEIQGKADTSEYYWILYVNGKKSATGISATRISSGDVIEWNYEHKY